MNKVDLKLYLTFLLFLLIFPTVKATPAATRRKFDLVVYGGTAGGIIAAIAAAREGLKVAVLEASNHVGGMVTGGLSRTDHGKKETVGGYALEFYQRAGRHYGKEIEWYPEPHVAESVLLEMIREAKVEIFFRHRLNEQNGVTMTEQRITSIRAENGDTFQGKIFVDASYEGDLMKQASVSYTWGRESTSQYNESLAGVRPEDPNHQFNFPISAYDERGNLLPEIRKEPRGEIGSGDKKVQAYNFRMILTRDPLNRVAFPRPANYHPERFELLARFLKKLVTNQDRPARLGDVFLARSIANNKSDFNNGGPFSTDYIGKSWGYPEASYKQRTEIWNDHKSYTKALFYFLANDPRVPERLQKELNEWGLARDEFTDNDNWPYQLYIREARRMIGDFVMTQKDIQTELTKADAIGMGSYNSDSHNVQRYVADGYVKNEGNMEVEVRPYQIPYRILLPKKSQSTNLLVNVCFSASHVTYSTLRMEPVYMILGQATGVAAKMAIEKKVAVQAIDTKDLAARLRSQGAVLNERLPDKQER
jgi:hypothetical protein